jgi:hypothetical protein
VKQEESPVDFGHLAQKLQMPVSGREPNMGPRNPYAVEPKLSAHPERRNEAGCAWATFSTVP